MKKIITILFLFAFTFINSQTGVYKPSWELLGSTTNSNNFLGTKNAQPLVIKTNNNTRLTIDAAGLATFNNGIAVSGGSNFSGGVTINGGGTMNGSYVFNSSITSPTVYGSSASGGTLNIQSTSNATKGVINIGTGTGTVNIPSPIITNTIQSATGNLIFDCANSTLIKVSGNTKISVLPSNVDINTTLSVASTATLAGTLKLGSSAVLTGGNTGTVAVLSDALFNLQFSHYFAALYADATTYYLGQFTDVISTNALNSVVYVPYNCTLVGWSFSGRVQTTAASAETSTISVRLNNTTDVLLSSAISYSAASGFNNQTGTVSSNLKAGDFINIKLVTPTWVTNPTNVGSGVTLWFVRRP